MRDGAEADPPHGYTDVVVVKYDRAGRRLWATRGVGGPLSDMSDALAIGSRGDVIVAGTFMRTGEFGGVPLALPARAPSTSSGRWIGEPRAMFVAALSPEGDVRRVVQSSPAERTSPTGVAAAPGGAVYVTGEQVGSARYGALDRPSAGDNAFLARLSGF